MNAIIPTRKRVPNPAARPVIRVMLSNCAKQTLIEAFEIGGGGCVLEDLDRIVKKLLRDADDSGDALTYMIGFLSENGIGLDKRPGSGEKVIIGQEHDIVYGAWLYAVRTRLGFAQKRMDRFERELNERIRYYNRNFDGACQDVNDVMINRLGRYHCHHADVLPAYRRKP